MYLPKSLHSFMKWSFLKDPLKPFKRPFLSFTTHQGNNNNTVQ